VRQDRSTEEVYRDILHAIHLLRRAGKAVSLSTIGRRAAVPYGRVRDRIAELQGLGLLDAELSVTQSGYGYCEEYLKHIDWFLRKYSLRGRV